MISSSDAFPLAGRNGHGLNTEETRKLWNPTGFQAIRRPDVVAFIL
jgi:hypothetical protein